MSKHILAPIAGAAVVALLITGCGASEDLAQAEDEPTAAATTEAATETESAEPAVEETTEEAAGQQDLVVEDSEFWRNSDGDWEYFVTVYNPNEDYLWQFAAFDVELLDADGVILDTGSDYGNLLPGETFAMVGTFYDSADWQAESINVRGPEDGTYMPDQEFGAFIVSEPEYKNDDWSATVSGTVESTFVEDQESVRMVAVVFDADGSPIATDWTYLDRIPTGGKARYELNFYDLKIAADNTIKVWALL
ncbi:hypothetical protein QQX13_06040 [Demequina sp. SYSU T00068]|uniref:hypothetical protein n=1 Tax=Demequina lignilytica TaxID=3051663 RepID=UPI002617F97A|nr:hypothetical protein [Demequina sp. SYSU T00068]MDN4490389.1 hypothetical protein [Demequina sp. SYSU T00068]